APGDLAGDGGGGPVDLNDGGVLVAYPQDGAGPGMGEGTLGRVAEGEQGTGAVHPAIVDLGVARDGAALVVTGAGGVAREEGGHRAAEAGGEGLRAPGPEGGGEAEAAEGGVGGEGSWGHAGSSWNSAQRGPAVYRSPLPGARSRKRAAQSF